MENLFDEFSSVSESQWWEQIRKDLKGADEANLFYKHKSGFTLAPFYTKTPDYGHALISPVPDWSVCHKIIVQHGAEKESNAEALAYLGDGVSGIIFEISEHADLKLLLKGIHADSLYLCFCLHQADATFLDELSNFIRGVSFHAQSPGICVRNDVYAHGLATGNFTEKEKSFVANFCHNLSSLPKEVPLSIDLRHFKNAGALPHTEIGIGLEILNEYLGVFSDAGMDFGSRDICFHVSVGREYFQEIAKLRAIKLCAQSILQEYGFSGKIRIHAESALLTHSNADIYSNVLRTTTIGMSAVLGGADAIWLAPADYLLAKPSTALCKLAKNQQLILKHESYLNKVSDPGAGSYYIEQYTLQLSKSGWNFFRELEREGGIISCISNSFIADRIAEEAKAFLNATENGSEIIIGVNKYQLPETPETELPGHLVSKADKKIPELFAGIKKAAVK